MWHLRKWENFLRKSWFLEWYDYVDFTHSFNLLKFQVMFLIDHPIIYLFFNPSRCLGLLHVCYFLPHNGKARIVLFHDLLIVSIFVWSYFWSKKSLGKFAVRSTKWNFLEGVDNTVFQFSFYGDFIIPAAQSQSPKKAQYFNSQSSLPKNQEHVSQLAARMQRAAPFWDQFQSDLPRHRGHIVTFHTHLLAL